MTQRKEGQFSSGNRAGSRFDGVEMSDRAALRSYAPVEVPGSKARTSGGDELTRRRSAT